MSKLEGCACCQRPVLPAGTQYRADRAGIVPECSDCQAADCGLARAELRRCELVAAYIAVSRQTPRPAACDRCGGSGPTVVVEGSATCFLCATTPPALNPLVEQAVLLARRGVLAYQRSDAARALGRFATPPGSRARADEIMVCGGMAWRLRDEYVSAETRRLQERYADMARRGDPSDWTRPIRQQLQDSKRADFLRALNAETWPPPKEQAS